MTVERRNGQYPPSTDPDARFDAVVARGERIRHRERATRRALTGAAVAAVVVVVIGVTTLAGGGSKESGTATAPDGGATAPTTTAPNSTAPTTTAPTTTTPTSLTATATVADGTVVVQVVEPHLPATDTAEMCVRVDIRPKSSDDAFPVAHGMGCWTPSDGDVPTTTALTSENLEVGCAATLSNEPSTTVAADATRLARHEFRFTMPSQLPAGDLEAGFVAASSATDACPSDSTDPNTATTTGSVAVPPR